MTEADLDVRRAVYDWFARHASAPTAADLAAPLGRTEEEVRASFLRLAEARALVLAADGVTIAKALPFCAQPTRHQLHIGGVTYYGNCAWDTFGLAAMFRGNGRITAECGDCAEKLELTLSSGQLDATDGLLLHFAIPAAAWWEDIFFT